MVKQTGIPSTPEALNQCFGEHVRFRYNGKERQGIVEQLFPVKDKSGEEHWTLTISQPESRTAEAEGFRHTLNRQGKIGSTCGGAKSFRLDRIEGDVTLIQF